MTTHRLYPHPATPQPDFDSLTVEIATGGDGISLRYTLEGRLETLVLPAPSPSGFADGLWQHTCFEAFFAPPASQAYREYNFSPSGQWAGYDFCDYRVRDTACPVPPGAQITLETGAKWLCLTARLPGAALPGAQAALGLSAVIETRHGPGYWALAHAGERPDFHLRQSFTATLTRTI